MTQSAFTKIKSGLEDALAISRGEAEPARITHFKYVRHHMVPAYEALGWEALPRVFAGTPHGEYSTFMRWGGTGELKEPSVD